MKSASASDASLPLAILERIDQVCLQFEAAWKRGEPIRIEQYLGENRGTERSRLLRELLALELDYRTRQGQRPTEDEYRGRFPEDTRSISRYENRCRQSLHRISL